MRSTVSAKAMRARRQADPNVAMVRWVLRRMTRASVIRQAFVGDTWQTEIVSACAAQVPFYTDRLRSAGFRGRSALTEEIWQKLPIVRRGDAMRPGFADRP